MVVKANLSDQEILEVCPPENQEVTTMANKFKKRFDLTPPKKKRVFTYPMEIKQRAFELFMDVHPKTLERRWSWEQIAKVIREEYGGKIPGADEFSAAAIGGWVKKYGWKGYFAVALEKAKDIADEDAEVYDVYSEVAQGIKCKTQSVDKVMRVIDEKAAVMEQIDKVAGVAASAIVEMFLLNAEHFKGLMSKRVDTGGWVYDCDRFSTRKQLFDMWMTGVTKLMDVYNLGTPKRLSTKAMLTQSALGQQALEIDSTVSPNVDLSVDNYELILKLFGIEQAKGGSFGSHLSGPNNADFPSKPGTEVDDGGGKNSADT